MRVGVPTEVKNHEYRVAITPAGVQRAHQARPRRTRPGRGRGSAHQITDDEFASMPEPRSFPAADDVWRTRSWS